MAKAVSRRHFTAKVQLWLWSSSSRVVMYKAALDHISRQVQYLGCTVSIISLMLHTHIHLCNILISRQSGGILGICIQSHEVRTPREYRTDKSLHTSFSVQRVNRKII